MELVKIEVEVPKASNDLAVAFGGLAGSLLAKKDGGLTVAEIAAAVGENIMQLMAALGEVQNVADEAKADPVGIAIALEVEIKKLLAPKV